MKYAFIIDSSSGLTKEEAEKLGYYFLPLHISVDGKEYRDGVDIAPKDFFNIYNIKSDVKTSSINVGETLELFEKLEKEYDRIIVYPISKHLSGSTATLTTLAQDFSKVRVIQSVEIVYLIIIDLIWLKMKLDEDPTKEDEYIKFIEDGGFRKSITLIPKYNDFLVKGGRLSPSAAAIARLFKIVPLIKFENGKLEKEGIGRVFNKTVVKNIESKKDFTAKDKEHEILYWYLHSSAPLEDQQMVEKAIYDNYKIDRIFKTFICPVVSIHTGPEASVFIAIEVPKKLAQVLRSLN